MDGLIAPGFEAVGEAFATDPRGGSALTILRDGEPVVELVEGWRDAARTDPWRPDTLVNVYSVGKPIMAAAFLADPIGGARNAGLLATKILATSDPDLSAALERFAADLAASVEEKNRALHAKL